MNPVDDRKQHFTRRNFLSMASSGVGAAALSTLFDQDLHAQSPTIALPGTGLPGLPHFAPKAKRVIYLFQSGAPSQHELFDYKPRLAQLVGTDLPPSVRGNQRVPRL